MSDMAIIIPVAIVLIIMSCCAFVTFFTQGVEDK
jgi:hypothetical protein